MTIFFFGLQNYGDYAHFGDVIDEQLLVDDSCDRHPLYNVYEDLILIQDYLKIGKNWGQILKYTKYSPLHVIQEILHKSCNFILIFSIN